MYFYNRRLSTFLYGLLFCLDLTRAQNTQLQTIFSLDIYSSQKPCAQGCFIRGGYCFQDIVGDAIGCVDDNVCGLGSSGLAVNECYCRTDLQAVAESFLTACVKSACTVGDSSIDISSAGSIYNSYCSAALATSVPAATTQEGTSGQPVTTMYVTTTVYLYRSCGISAAGLGYSMAWKIWELFFFLVYISAQRFLTYSLEIALLFHYLELTPSFYRSSSSPPMTSSPLSSGSVPSIPTTIRNNVSSTPTNSGSITAAKPSSKSLEDPHLR